MRRIQLVVLASLVAVAGCIPKPAAPPAPAPQPAPAPPPPPPPAALDWRDLPLTPGAWSYSAGAGTSEARFGAAEGARFLVRCERVSGIVVLSRPDAPAGTALTIRTSNASRSLAASNGMVSLSVGDPLLDSMVFSRGRFTVEAPGVAMLVIPAWPEPARVIEDCRS